MVTVLMFILLVWMIFVCWLEFTEVGRRICFIAEHMSVDRFKESK